MKRIDLLLTAREPLVLTDGAAESMGHQTLMHIPGSMLLGAFAAQWAKSHKGVDPDADPEFVALFLDGKVEWGNAYPCVAGEACVPIPLCWQRDKLKKGLPTEGNAPGNCGVYNFLLRDFDAPPEKNDEQKVVKYKKLSAGFMSPKALCMPDITTSWSMHVALSDQRRAAESQLFGYSSVALGPVFRSAIYCHDDNAADAVQRLLAKAPEICVGHSRSAGYGRVACECKVASMPEEKLAGNGAVLFFLSDYLPLHSWNNPLGSLLTELETALGVLGVKIPDDRKIFCSYQDIVGFNGLWTLPRRTTTVIQKGSVLQIAWEGEAKTFPHSLGGRRSEGYGRFLLNPDFLKAEEVVPEGLVTERALTEPTLVMSPLLRSIRRRSLDRLAEEAAATFVSRVDGFIGSVAGKDIPSPSQLGNIRNMVTLLSGCLAWNTQFASMLTKTPGKQWEGYRVLCPFADHYDKLKAIMPRFFKVENCLDLLQENPTDHLPGGKASPDEQVYFNEKFHRLAMLNLLGAWEKAKRQSKSGNRRAK